ncbi:hypothetical protein SAMN05444410_11965 [Hydrobacter penzbergensis]|uniref:Uncharacterized protein n=2 Tax=Hydrobacter penzbergensis TaxID=1235997 RepID=A0A8X8LF72_9BACT|nr:hypothetical protein SAMN05444410_11965 [Hydrobacter penzbergensis]
MTKNNRSFLKAWFKIIEMHKLSFFLTVCFCSLHISIAQNNTFPSSGKIGIGTLNPSVQLHVTGIAATPFYMGYLSTGNIHLKVQTRPDANYGISVFDAINNTAIQSGEIVNGTSTSTTHLVFNFSYHDNSTNLYEKTSTSSFDARRLSIESCTNCWYF